MFINSLEYRITRMVYNYATVCSVEGNILSIEYYSAQGIRVFREPNSPRLCNVEISPFGPTNFFSSQWKFYFNFILMKMRAQDTTAAY